MPIRKTVEFDIAGLTAEHADALLDGLVREADQDWNEAYAIRIQLMREEEISQEEYEEDYRHYMGLDDE